MVQEMLSFEELKTLENAKLLADNAALAHKNAVLSVYVQHGMSPADSITPEGIIVRAPKPEPEKVEG